MVHAWPGAWPGGGYMHGWVDGWYAHGWVSGQNQKDPMALDKIMKDLDQCRDGKVGFQSFFSLVAGLTIACNDYFVVHMKQKGKK
nr:PREDICTED: protein S100-A10 [Struthio camelus australis]